LRKMLLATLAVTFLFSVDYTQTPISITAYF
jgi:hypothetical protein